MSTPLQREALRYLGVRDADARTLAMVAEGFDRLEVAAPRHVMATLAAEDAVRAFGSMALREHLEGCETAVLLAATLGAQADRLVRQAEAADVVMGAVLHACAAAKIEAYCDAVQAGMVDANRPRFSPGYGDFPLEKQEKLLAMVDAGRRIGLYLTQGCVMVPTKSITAVIGLGPAVVGCAQEKCTRCGKLDCAYRADSV